MINAVNRKDSQCPVSRLIGSYIDNALLYGTISVHATIDTLKKKPRGASWPRHLSSDPVFQVTSSDEECITTTFLFPSQTQLLMNHNTTICRVLSGLCLLLLAPLGRAQELPIRFETGPLFTYLRVPFSPPINDQNQIAIGGRFSWNFSRHFGLDGEIDASPVRTTNLTTSYQGGFLLQSFFGIKAGRRWDRFGMFGKFRPGVNSYSRVITGVSQSSFQLGRRTDPAFDVGLITEFYISRRILLRYDFGDTIIHYSSGSVGAVPVQGATRNNLQFSTSLAFRFR